MSIDSDLEELFSDIVTDGEKFDYDAPRDAFANWDSLANMKLMMAINEEFGEVLTLEDFEKIVSFNSALTLIKSRL